MATGTDSRKTESVGAGGGFQHPDGGLGKGHEFGGFRRGEVF